MNSNVKGLTVVSMTNKVDTYYLRELFPNIKIIEWDMDVEEVPSEWEQQLWEGFGCGQNSNNF